MNAAPTVPVTSSRSQTAVLAAGRVEHEQRGPFPDEEERERHDDVGDARDHHGDPVDRAQPEARSAG